jgi:hypothetical protein
MTKSCRWIFPCLVILAVTAAAHGQSSPSSSPSSSAKHLGKASGAGIDTGTVTNGVYRNKTLGLACKIPEGWVLRTDEMNRRDDEAGSGGPPGTVPPASSAGAQVLLAAFSRPPEAKGEEVNKSILIAEESAASYPGLTEAAQYFGPIIEVAKAQGFEMDEDPYAIAVGAKTLVRGDFHKNVGTRVMRQSTLVLLDHGYAVSITVIGGTDDEVEDLVDGLSFAASAGAKK